MAKKKVENHSKSSESPWKVGNGKNRGQGVYYNRVTGQSGWCKPDRGESEPRYTFQDWKARNPTGSEVPFQRSPFLCRYKSPRGRTSTAH